MQKYLIFFICLMLAFSCKQNDRKEAPQSNDIVQNEEKDSTNTPIKTIMFFGNSITAGFGLDPNQAFPAIIEQKLKEAGLSYQVVNAGNSGETSAGGLQRVDWMLKQRVDIFVLELGANDGLRGIPVTEMKSNLEGIIEKVRAKYPDGKIILAAMEALPNMGPDYTKAFRKAYMDIAREKNVIYLPFLLDKVAGNPALNLPDGIHPTAEGHEMVAEAVWNVLKENI